MATTTSTTNTTQSSTKASDLENGLTYDGFLKSATDAGLLSQFSESDLATAKQYPVFGYSLLTQKQNYNNATTDEARYLANATANDLRNTFGGYTAGTDGSQYSTTAMSPTSFQSAAGTKRDNTLAGIESSAFDSQGWGDTKDSLANQFINMNYTDWTNGDSYAALKDRYTTNGQTAMNDTLGTVSARTGGLASTYATQAAQQTYNEYMDALEEAAQEAYANERSELSDKYNMAGNQYSTLYGEYQDKLSNDWNLYNAYDAQNTQEYNQFTDEHEWNEEEDDKNYDRQTDAYNKLATLISSYGYKPTEEELEEAGISDDLFKTLYSSWYRNTYSSGSSGSSGSGSSSSGSSSSTQYSAIEEIYNSGSTTAQTAFRTMYAMYNNGSYDANDVADRMASAARDGTGIFKGINLEDAALVVSAVTGADYSVADLATRTISK